MTEQQEKIIELKNVGVTYRERKSFFKSESYEALKDISFDVYKGETLGIIGRNGAGKSTLLRLLAGIIKPDRGEVIHHTKSVSLMALAAGFDPNLSGRQNAVVSGMLLGYSKKHITDKLEEIKTFSELQSFFEKPVKTYSSGMKTRLGFSVAMFVSPDVLLIDEVLAVGDASFRQKAERALEEKIASDITVIIVSHSEPQVRRLAQRVVWIDGGKVRQQGLPPEIFPKYNLNSQFSTFNLRVEQYIKSNDYLFWFEDIKPMGDKVKFRAVLIDLKDRKLKQFITKCNNEIISELSGPTETMGYHIRYAKIDQASHARYHNGLLCVGKNMALTIEADSIETEILRIKLEAN
ncbi:MAG: ABC transporter ATP-binding protein [Vibrio sp.]|uniref:ABC transporter ATP-binding protein n=1 Tax=Vibrio sp. TaxID=678 RepID=UPI003A86599F